MKIVVFLEQIVNTQVKLYGVDYFDSSKASEDDLVINPTSKNAIEGALKLKKALGAEVTAVCMQGLKPIKAIREAIAMGCDSGIEVANDGLYNDDPLVIAKVYTKVLEKIGDYDLVLLGVEEQPTGAYAVSAMLAELLNLPSVLYAEEIETLDNSLKITHIIEGGKKIVEMPMKGVISCTDSQYFVPRYTSMRGILTAKRAVIPKWELSDIGLTTEDISKDAALIKEVSMSNIVIEKETYIIKEGEPEEMVEELLSKLKEDEVKLGA
ncbi:MAG: electron transfer flavoprotein subunit beta/FixA family protein [Candidatus Heimdallarchaeaceae archaeon]